MNLFRRGHHLACEQLESRRLLAADLRLTTSFPAGPFLEGDETSYSFVATNRGEELQQVLIYDTPTTQLQEVSWASSKISFPTNMSTIDCGRWFRNRTNYVRRR